MELDASEISGSKTNVTPEASDTDSSSYQVYKTYTRHGNVAPSSRFKGVVCQQNGNWGAQIYAKYQRIWLGTFRTEKDAAMAYDSAAIKLRSGDSYRNFPWTNVTIQEPDFQSQFSTEEVLGMIKDGSYSSKFAEYLNAQFSNGTSGSLNDGARVVWKQLFQKELTPSDVGKLNRLVIPKKFALQFFPHISGDGEENDESDGVDDTELVFFDRSMRSWKFRYCYWKSSQSYVFTRGWNKYVKEKRLRAKDMVVFSTCESVLNGGRTVCMIDVGYHDGRNGGVVEHANNGDETLQLELGYTAANIANGVEILESSAPVLIRNVAETEVDDTSGGKDDTMAIRPTTNTGKKSIRLFGVEISMPKRLRTTGGIAR